MVKSIPIFEFAFAAYAATSNRSDANSSGPSRPPFIETWNAVGARGDLLVKVELRDDKRGAATAFGPQRPAPAGSLREVWLGDIQETARGFSGAVRMSQERLTHVRVGQRVRFDPTHILDWTISYDPSAELGLCETTGA
jgi:hypothetical protein